jgi:hypothetical protein
MLIPCRSDPRWPIGWTTTIGIGRHGEMVQRPAAQIAELDRLAGVTVLSRRKLVASESSTGANERRVPADRCRVELLRFVTAREPQCIGARDGEAIADPPHHACGGRVVLHRDDLVDDAPRVRVAQGAKDDERQDGDAGEEDEHVVAERSRGTEDRRHGQFNAAERQVSQPAATN